MASKPFETWATLAPPDRFSEGVPRVCLWGTRAEAEGGRDDDERVCLVRVQVLRVARRRKARGRRR